MDSRPEKKTEQDALLEIQMRAAKSARIPDILTLATSVVFILALTILMFVIPDESFSEQENRMLQQFPKISSEGKFLDRLVDGKFTAEISKYYSDQFPFRDTFVGFKGILEIGMLKSENDGIMLGSEGYLVTKDSPDKDIGKTMDQIIKNIDEISAFADVMDQMGHIPVTLAVAGRSVDVLDKYLPAAYSKQTSESLWGLFVGLADFAPNIRRLDLIGPLKQQIERGDRGQLYYKTDHHWTTRGAYYAYVEIINSFKEEGLEPLPLSAFTIETASDEFYGTTWSKAGMKWIGPENLEYFRYEGDEDFVTTIVDTKASFKGFYDREYLDKKDKYGSFLSGNNARVDITRPLAPGEQRRPKLLLFKDSFAHSIAPFLAYHFDLVILDYRYYRGSAAKLVYEEGIDRVLFLHNLENFSDEGQLYGVPGPDPGLLQYGVEDALENYRLSQYPIRGIYINSNPIKDYSIVIPTEENDTRKYYITAAESLKNIISERAGVELEIVRADDWAGLEKIIAFTSEGLPASGFIKIATEGDDLIFRCNIGSDSPGYAAGIFIDKYLKRTTGSFNFGADFIYSDIGDTVIMLRPER